MVCCGGGGGGVGGGSGGRERMTVERGRCVGDGGKTERESRGAQGDDGFGEHCFGGDSGGGGGVVVLVVVVGVGGMAGRVRAKIVRRLALAAAMMSVTTHESRLRNQ